MQFYSKSTLADIPVSWDKAIDKGMGYDPASNI